MLYELLVFWRDGDNLLEIDTHWSKSRSDLEYTANERKKNNPEYQCVILDYKAISANIV